MRSAVVACLVSVGLLGCANVETAMPTVKMGQSVPVGQRAKVAVGDAMLAHFNYSSAPGARLLDSVNMTVINQRIVVNAGEHLIQSKVDGQAGFCTGRPAVFGRAFGNAIGHACFFDRNGDGLFDAVKGLGDGWGEQVLSPTRYQTVEVPFGEGFKQELLYQGKNGNALSVSYREYTNNFARPAFQQDLTYTLNENGTAVVAFRAARITVHKATNTEIDYTVDAGLSR